jgi:two-component system, NarL family, invasion response regulator UvrY
MARTTGGNPFEECSGTSAIVWRRAEMRIIIVDDHQVVRHGIRRILEEEYPDVTIDEAGTAEDAAGKIFKGSWDLVILDLSMPGKGGLELLHELRSGFCKTPVLVQTFHQQGEYALRALRAGADGYVTKDVSVDKLVAAVHKILAGGRYVSDEVTENVLSDLTRRSIEAPVESLSNREYEVMIRIALGQSSSEIADGLHISVKTVGTYRARILEKMGFQRSVDLTLYAVRHGLID